MSQRRSKALLELVRLYPALWVARLSLYAALVMLDLYVVYVILLARRQVSAQYRNARRGPAVTTSRQPEPDAPPIQR